MVGALGARPKSIRGLDAVARGKVLDDSLAAAIAGEAHRQSRPLTNLNVDPEWRREMVAVTVARMLGELVESLT